MRFTHMIKARTTKLVPRCIEAAEAVRLGIAAGWYGTRISGTVMTGPHLTEQTCLTEIGRVGRIAQDQTS